MEDNPRVNRKTVQATSSIGADLLIGSPSRRQILGYQTWARWLGKENRDLSLGRVLELG